MFFVPKMYSIFGYLFVDEFQFRNLWCFSVNLCFSVKFHLETLFFFLLFRIDDLAQSNQYNQAYAEQSVRPQQSQRDDYSRVQTKDTLNKLETLKTEIKTETENTEKIITEIKSIKQEKLPESNTIADMQVLNKSLMKLNIQTFDSLSSFHL